MIKLLLKTEAAVHRCTSKKSIFKNFAVFTGEHLCRSSLFLIKLQAFYLLNTSGGRFCKNKFSSQLAMPEKQQGIQTPVQYIKWSFLRK